jgi:hypothetical protein
MSNEHQGNAEPAFSDDLLRGAAEIAEFLYGDRKYRRRVYYLWASENDVPITRGRVQLHALKSALRAYFSKKPKRPSDED